MISRYQFYEFAKAHPKGGVLYAINDDLEIVIFTPTAYVTRCFMDGTEKHEIEGGFKSLPYGFDVKCDFLTRNVFLTEAEATNDLGARLADVHYELKDPKEEEEI